MLRCIHNERRKDLTNRFRIALTAEVPQKLVGSKGSESFGFSTFQRLATLSK